MLLPAAVRRNGSPPAPEFPTGEAPGHMSRGCSVI